MAQNKGRKFELSLCNDIYDATDESLIPEPVGYSGNHTLPAPDIHIDDGGKVHAIELKRTARDQVSLYYDDDDYQKDDLKQLITYCENHPRLAVPYIGVRFDNRQLLLIKLWLEAPMDEAVVRSAESLAPVDTVGYTRAGNISVRKPSLDEWKSASSGDDVEHILETIGYL